MDSYTRLPMSAVVSQISSKKTGTTLEYLILRAPRSI
jgi:hypothetical protein